MSRLHKAVLGIPQGTLGQLVFRIKRGIAYIATRPISFMPGTAPADVARRSRFGLTCRFSRQVNSIDQLKKLWASPASKGSAYNRITRTNYPMVTDSAVTDAAVVTPPGGLGLNIISAVLTNTTIQIEIDSLLTDKIDTTVETKVRLTSVLYLSGPIAAGAPAETFMPIVSPVQAFAIDSPIIFTLDLDSQDTLVYDQYTNHKLFYAIVTEDEDGKVYHFSKSCSA